MTAAPIPIAVAQAQFKLHSAEAIKQKRRALIRAVGVRQFKKIYREAKV